MNASITLNIIIYSTVLWEICNQLICFLNKENRQYNSDIVVISMPIIFSYSFLYCYVYEFLRII